MLVLSWHTSRAASLSCVCRSACYFCSIHLIAAACLSVCSLPATFGSQECSNACVLV